MRCPDCNRFAAYDDSTEPEVELTLNDDGSFNGTVRIVLTHDECGAELKEGNFDIEGQIPAEVVQAHQGDGHDLDLTGDDCGLDTRTEGSGRYMKTFYGYHMMVELTCSCEGHQSGIWSEEFNDDMQASHMDELV